MAGKENVCFYAPPETRVLRRGMLDNQLDDNAYPQFPRVINQLNNVTDLPKTRIGLQMILHVVTVIEKWRQIKGG